MPKKFIKITVSGLARDVHPGKEKQSLFIDDSCLVAFDNFLEDLVKKLSLFLVIGSGVASSLRGPLKSMFHIALFLRIQCGASWIPLILLRLLS